VVLTVNAVDSAGDLSFNDSGVYWYVEYYDLYKGNETMNTTTAANKANKAEAISRIEAIEKELQELKKVVEQEDKPEIGCLIKTPECDDGEYKSNYISDTASEFKHEEYYSIHQNPMHFADAGQCQRYADALTTFILLRKQHGSEAAVEGVEQFTIEPKEDKADIHVNVWKMQIYKIRGMSPCFKTREAAEDAIKALGEERILNMFKAFHS
jgi:hypothetical protein